MLLDREPVVAPPEPRRRGRRRRKLPAHWPLSVALLGFPIWWLLGLSVIVPILMAVVMADQMLRRRRLVLPAGFTVWALFLAWLALGALVLFADAPGAEPGGGPSRLLTFGYRGAWYLTATIVLLWITNLKESELPSRWLYQLLGYMFVVATIGGLLGVLLPNVEFTSPLEMVLPHGLRANGLVKSIVHPQLADIQNVLGRPEARPKAPFPFANSWGSNISMYLLFFVVAWFRSGKRWQLVLGPVVMLVATVPIVYSLNRGLWASLVLGVIGAMILVLRSARLVPIIATLSLLVIVTVSFFLSPLDTIFQERLQHQHSNDRRSELISRTVQSTVDGSPVVGFGSTRDVQGGFSSIASADTPDCESCGVPPLGTQGHIWGVIFSQGIGGAILFVSFFLLALWRSWRCRTTNETLCTFVLVFFGLQIFVYDTLGLPLVTVMIAIGMVAREQASGRTPRLLSSAWNRVMACAPYLVALMLAGAALGGYIASRAPVNYATQVSIMLAPPPVYLATSDLSDVANLPGDVTIDTEAALVISRQSLSRVLGSRDAEVLKELRQRVRITAAPNTQVLHIEVRDRDRAESQKQAAALARSYLLTRRDYLSNRRDQTLELLREQIGELRGSGQRITYAAQQSASREQLQAAVTAISLTPTSAGEVIRTQEPVRLLGRAEVPVATGAALGLAVGAVLMAAFPGWRPRRRWRKRRP